MYPDKIITKLDDVWHDSAKELPTIGTDVEFMDKDGNIHQGEIVVEMSGWYVYQQDIGWGSFDDFIKWRFIPNKEYPYYNNK